MTRTTISLPSDLCRRIKAQRSRINVSGICARALAEEVRYLERVFAASSSPSDDRVGAPLEATVGLGSETAQ